MAADRRQSRILAMQALCQWDAHHDESPEALSDLLGALAEGRGGIGYATRLVRGFWLRQQQIDEQIEAAATGWDLRRISLVERNAIRVAVVEMKAGEVPPKVALDEAIEIGREYGGADSPRFINGVLDVILKSITGGVEEDI